MSARLMLALRRVAAWIDEYADSRHLTTDPACREFTPPRPGSRLDRASRGHSCTLCMVGRAFGHDEDCHWPIRPCVPPCSGLFDACQVEPDAEIASSSEVE
ncbi:hypothetical protein AKH00_06730 [Microbacterium sp. GCS4]|nr:hypothetical protein AKH00_06730 [Microbacterium sp. GCS4]